MSPSQPENLEENLDALVRDGEYLSFDVRATDTAGGPLFCEIEAFNSAGASVKGFAASGNQRMHWDQATEEWVSDWAWSPPPNDSAGETYNIVATVRNKDGEEAFLDEAAQPVVEKRRGGKFLVTSEQETIIQNEVESQHFSAVLNDDGSNFRFIPFPEKESSYFNSVFSRNGQEVLSSGRSGPGTFFFQRYNLASGNSEVIPMGSPFFLGRITAEGAGSIFLRSNALGAPPELFVGDLNEPALLSTQQSHASRFI